MGGANAVSRALCSYLLATYLLAGEDYSDLKRRLAPLMRRRRPVVLTEKEKLFLQIDDWIQVMFHKTR